MEDIVHDEFFSNFTVVTATTSAIDYLPEKPGIYAFYHAFDFLEADIASGIDDRLQNTVFKTKFYEENDKRRFIIDTCGESVSLSVSMRQFIDAVSHPADRKLLRRYLMSCSILQRPDYIGTATDIRSRFVQHLDRQDGFFAKYGNARPQDEFLFLCYPCPKNISRQLESLLIQLCQPKFNTQRS